MAASMNVEIGYPRADKNSGYEYGGPFRPHEIRIKESRTGRMILTLEAAEGEGFLTMMRVRLTKETASSIAHLILAVTTGRSPEVEGKL